MKSISSHAFSLVIAGIYDADCRTCSALQLGSSRPDIATIVDNFAPACTHTYLLRVFGTLDKSDKGNSMLAASLSRATRDLVERNLQEAGSFRHEFRGSVDRLTRRYTSSILAD